MNTVKTLFNNALVIDGLGSVIEKGWVLIDEDRIAKVGTAVEPPDMQGGETESMEVIDLNGKAIIPGLIDCHVHLSHDASADPHSSLIRDADPLIAIKTASNAKCTLESGMTTVRDLGAKNHIDVHIRDAISSGLLAGPRMLCAGQMICMTGGHGWQIGLEVDGPDEVIKTARQQIKKGVDVVKFMATGGVMTPGVEPGAAQFTLEELKAGVDAAHRAFRKTAAHAQGREGIKNAVLAGIDSIEHGIYLDDEIIELMLAKGIFLVPTLSAPINILAQGEKAGIPDHIVEKTRRVADTHFKSLIRAKEAGVKIAMGTDAGTPFNHHGRNASELRYLVENGFSAGEALISATSMAAELLGLLDTLGSISQNKLADIIVLEKNPLKDISVLDDPQNIWAIYKSGVIVAGIKEKEVISE